MNKLKKVVSALAVIACLGLAVSCSKDEADNAKNNAKNAAKKAVDDGANKAKKAMNGKD